MYYSNPLVEKSWEQKEFFTLFRKLIDHLLSSKDVICKLAVHKEDPTQIVGFSVIKKNLLHFVYVKADWRGIGIAKDLVPETIDRFKGFKKEKGIEIGNHC